jgi:hypothetical protein
MGNRVHVQAWQLRVGDVIAEGWTHAAHRVTAIEVMHTVPKQVLVRTVYQTGSHQSGCMVVAPRREFVVLR